MRKRRAVKRDILPDPIYKSKVVTKLINQIMNDGKKGTAQKILYGAFDMIKEKMIIGGKPIIINNQPFLHVGQCVYVDVIKEFLDTHKITYYVGTDPSNEEKVN